MLRRRLQYAWDEIARLNDALERFRDQGPGDDDRPVDTPKSLRGEVETLRQALSEKAAELDGTTAEVQRLASQLQGLAMERTKALARAVQTGKEVRTLREMVEGLQRSLDTTSLELGSNQKARSLLELELEQRTAALDVLQRRLAMETQEAETLSLDVAALEGNQMGRGGRSERPLAHSPQGADATPNADAPQRRVGMQSPDAAAGGSAALVGELAPQAVDNARGLRLRGVMLFVLCAILVSGLMLWAWSGGARGLHALWAGNAPAPGSIAPDVAEPGDPSRGEPAVSVDRAVAHRQAAGAAQRRQGTRDRLAVGGLGPEMVAVGPALFEMGSNASLPYESEWPLHQVNVGRFLIGTKEVTFAEFDLFARSTGGRLPEDYRWGRGQRPVVGVNWDDAVAYTTWLSRQTGQRYRLPSEAEWEYAARGGSPRAYWWGHQREEGRAICFDCGTPWDNRATAPVASRTPNAFGLYDTAGNVMEWVGDCWNPDYSGAPADAKARTDGDCETRVARGGAFNRPALSMRSAARHHFIHDTRVDMLGFRVARDL